MILQSVLQALLTPDKSKAPFQQLPLPAIAAAGAGAAVSQPSGAASSQPAQPPSERSVVVIRAPPMSELLETSMPYTEMLAKVRDTVRREGVCAVSCLSMIVPITSNQCGFMHILMAAFALTAEDQAYGLACLGCTSAILSWLAQ